MSFRHESTDGYDFAVEWAATLPIRTAKWGYDGRFVCRCDPDAGCDRPSAPLAGIYFVVTASNYHENWTYQGGAEQWFDQNWATQLATGLRCGS